MGIRLRRIETLVKRDLREVGGKARHLAALARAGLPVPEGVVVPASMNREFLARTLPKRDWPEQLLKQGPDSWEDARLAGIRETVMASPLDPSLRQALGAALTSLTTGPVRTVAVRSSSVFEDNDEVSGAGILASTLHVGSPEDLADALKGCWASVFNQRVLRYLFDSGAKGVSAIGVIVQTMVPADVAGVLFTANPVTGDMSELVINASYGLGCAVADGAVSPDVLRVDKDTRQLRDCVVGAKERRWDAASHGGLAESEVVVEMRERLCLDERLRDELVRLALRVEERFGDPRDIEWAVYAGRVYLLQGRPITTGLGGAPRRKPRTNPEGGPLVWSNVNVGEALPGPATPLTWSVASSFSELGFRRAFGALGCTVPKDAELVGNFRGRIYLNLTEFMSILSQVPGLSAKTLLSLGGGGGLEELESSIEHRSSVKFLARLPITAGRYARENFRVLERARAFDVRFAMEMRRLEDIDLRILSLQALASTLNDRERLLDATGSIMLTVYGNLLSTVVLLRSVIQALAPDQADALQRDLLSGLADVDSAAPGLAIWHIAELARGETGARDTILNAERGELQLSDIPEGPTSRALENFLKAYGHRGPREAELSEPRWVEDPSLVLSALRLHLTRAGSELSPLHAERQIRLRREGAEKSLQDRLPGPARTALRHLLSLVHRFTRLRERLRDHVVQVMGLFRSVALETSRRLELRDERFQSDAAFFLTLDEMKATLRTRPVDALTLVTRRRRAYQGYLRMPDPPHTFTGHPPPVAEPLPTDSRMKGLAASAGIAEGRARVLHRPEQAGEFECDEVLVVSVADVGWSPLFLAASAVVTDLGGPLSHASVVLREYGIPAVVNLHVGTRCIRTGDLIRVDGERGWVEILERADGT